MDSELGTSPHSDWNVIVDARIPLGSRQHLDFSQMQQVINDGQADHPVGRIVFTSVVSESNRRFLMVRIALFDTPYGRGLLENRDACVADIHGREYTEKNALVVDTLSCGHHSEGYTCAVKVHADNRGTNT